MPSKEHAEMQRYIQEAVDLTMSKALEHIYPGGPVNFFKAMESLLYNYKRLKALVSEPEAYINAVAANKSKDVVRYSESNGGWRDPEDAKEERIRDREASYDKTKADFDRLDKVIERFRREREFPVIAMYYLHEDALGLDRDPDARKYTWEDIVLELDSIGIEATEKTARQWRSKMINDMSVCMFGAVAAISSGTYRKALTDYRNATV